MKEIIRVSAPYLKSPYTEYRKNTLYNIFIHFADGFRAKYRKSAKLLPALPPMSNFSQNRGIMSKLNLEWLSGGGGAGGAGEGGLGGGRGGGNEGAIIVSLQVSGPDRISLNMSRERMNECLHEYFIFNICKDLSKDESGSTRVWKSRIVRKLL